MKRTAFGIFLKERLGRILKLRLLEFGAVELDHHFGAIRKDSEECCCPANRQSQRFQNEERRVLQGILLQLMECFVGGHRKRAALYRLSLLPQSGQQFVEALHLLFRHETPLPNSLQIHFRPVGRPLIDHS